MLISVVVPKNHEVNYLWRLFNIIYIMRTHIVVAKLLSFLLDKLLVDSASIDSDDGSCGGVFCFG